MLSYSRLDRLVCIRVVPYGGLEFAVGCRALIFSKFFFFLADKKIQICPSVFPHSQSIKIQASSFFGTA